MNWSEAPYIADLLHWISEREHVRIRKEEEKWPAPWTDDPILQTTRFCNVRREDDKVTRWIKDNWRDPYSSHPNLAFAMCLARVINWPPTLQFLGFPEHWQSGKFVREMDALQKSGARIWTGAYMVTGGFSKGGETKQVIMARVLDSAYENCKGFKDDWLRPKTLQHAFNLVQQTPGLGTFLAAQVIADLKYTPLLMGAPDWQSFCAPGPGSTMGLNFLHGRPPTKGISNAQFSTEVNSLSEWLRTEHGVDLTAHDTQNCLCEFSKYVRIKYLGGRAKTGYPGRG